jgi:hypothetical protein
MKTRLIRWTIAGLAMLGAPSLAARDGWGMLGSAEATLVVVRPARIALGGGRLLLRVTGIEPADGPLARRLSSELESELNRRRTALATSAVDAQLIVDVKILAHGHSEHWQRPQSLMSTLAQWSGSSALSAQEEVVRTSLRLAYTLTAGGRVVDADTLDLASAATVSQGEGAPSASESEEQMLIGASSQLADRLTPTRERVVVRLPRGPLAALAPLAQAGEWVAYRAALERTTSADPQAESYRQYALGLAHEGVAYAEATPALVVAELERAETCYAAAQAANRGEKYYAVAPGSAAGVSPLVRVRASLAAYQRVTTASPKGLEPNMSKAPDRR